jgi:hypothetical protein
MKPRILELQTLVNNGACADQLALFRKMFGYSVAITPELCVSVADKFNFTWAARLLSSAALAEFKRVTAPALAGALADYKRTTASTFGELFCKEE